MDVDQLFKPVVRRGIEWLSRNRLPQVDGSLRLPGLLDGVKVYRDHWGVPHIYAENEHDLFLAQGFVHAQDRMWQMEFVRRMAAGRLSEVLGSASLAVDRWMRVLGLQRVSEQEVRLLDETEGPILSAYVSGVNAFLQVGRLPVEFSLLRYQPEPWQMADSLSFVKILNWYLSGNWECELLRRQLVDRLGPELARELELGDEDSWPIVLDIPDLVGLEKHLSRLARPFVGAGPGEGVGSNNWVLSGERTTTGKPILANDMHLSLMAPPLWYENHLAGGAYHLTGVSLPGSPLVVSGHNGRVAWGFTAGFADTQDLYEERLRRESGENGGAEQVWAAFGAEWYPVEVRQEAITVRGGSPEIQEVLITRHGPIINPLVPEETGEPLALHWTSLQAQAGLLTSLSKMNRANDCLAFREATREWTGPVLNTVYADVEGNIAYSLIGKVPLRQRGDGRMPAPGWDEAYEWQGWIDFEDLPHHFNPAQGYVASANNRLAGPEYPHMIGCDFYTGDRAERISEMILARQQVDIAYVQRMQFDQLSPSAHSLAHIFRQGQALPELADRQIAPLVAMLAAWDGFLTADSPAAAVYQVLNRQLLRLLLEHRLGDLLPRYIGKGPNDLFPDSLWGYHAQEWLRKVLVQPQSKWYDLGGGETREEVLAQALRRTLDFLQTELGPQPADWAWGRLHVLNFQHVLGMQKPLDAAFNRGPYPLGGDGSTIWASYSVLDDPRTGVTAGPPFRFIADLSDLDHCWGLLAPGESGHPGSPHYDDQIQAWFEGQYHPMLFNRAEVEQGQESCLELTP